MMTMVHVNNRPFGKSVQGLFDTILSDFEKLTPVSTINSVIGQAAPVNIWENEDSWMLELYVPGRTRESFSLSVENGTLTITGENPPAEAAGETWPRLIRGEFKPAGFRRSFQVSDLVNTEAIAAKYEDGVLRVNLPKKAETKPAVRQIAIQ